MEMFWQQSNSLHLQFSKYRGQNAAFQRNARNTIKEKYRHINGYQESCHKEEQGVKIKAYKV